MIEGKRGFCRIYSDKASPELVLDELGTRWEIARNGHKPYACGVVLHPALDAMVALRGTHVRSPAEIERVELAVHPFAVRITGLTDPDNRAAVEIQHLSCRRCRLSRRPCRHRAVHR